jgi:hypothetical protein
MKQIKYFEILIDNQVRYYQVEDTARFLDILMKFIKVKKVYKITFILYDDGTSTRDVNLTTFKSNTIQYLVAEKNKVEANTLYLENVIKQLDEFHNYKEIAQLQIVLKSLKSDKYILDYKINQVKELNNYMLYLSNKEIE